MVWLFSGLRHVLGFHQFYNLWIKIHILCIFITFYVFLGLVDNALFVVSFCTLHPLIQVQHLLEDPLPECIYQKRKDLDKQYKTC